MVEIVEERKVIVKDPMFTSYSGELKSIVHPSVPNVKSGTPMCPFDGGAIISRREAPPRFFCRTAGAGGSIVHMCREGQLALGRNILKPGVEYGIKAVDDRGGVEWVEACGEYPAVGFALSKSELYVVGRL